MRCPRRLTLHDHTQYAVDARLVALAMTLEPIEHVLIQTNGQLLFRRRPGQRRLFAKRSGRDAECASRLYRHPSYGQSRLARRQPDSRRDGGATLQRRFPQRLKPLLILRQLRHGCSGSRKSREGGDRGIPPLRKKPRKDGAPGKKRAKNGPPPVWRCRRKAGPPPNASAIPDDDADSAKSSSAQTTLVPLSSIFERTINTLLAGAL